jgi:hypothetical protein
MQDGTVENDDKWPNIWLFADSYVTVCDDHKLSLNNTIKTAEA